MVYLSTVTVYDLVSLHENVIHIQDSVQLVMKVKMRKIILLTFSKKKKKD